MLRLLLLPIIGTARTIERFAEWFNGLPSRIYILSALFYSVFVYVILALVYLRLDLWNLYAKEDTGTRAVCLFLYSLGLAMTLLSTNFRQAYKD